MASDQEYEQLKQERDQAVAERDALLAFQVTHMNYDASDPTPTLTVNMANDLVKSLGCVLAEMFVVMGGTNYVSWTVESKSIGPLELLLRRRHGKTEATVNGELMAENAALKAEIARMKEPSNI